uniref:DUF1758 domain-containing protein n=1 Tax=Loa loa TaxID=7209 RepID=A0A1I7VFX5_LOALO
MEELYKSLERARCSNKETSRMIRELLNLLSQLKGLGESIETAQLDVMVTDRIPEDMGLKDSRRSTGTQNGEWYQTFDSLLNSEGENISSKVSQKKEGSRLPCIFCEGWNDRCDTYPTVDERMKRLKKLGLCELCLKNDHSQETCMRIKCFYCGSGHNSALCKKRNEMKQSKNFKNSEETNISPKTVAATVADDSIRDTYMMCKEVRLINPDEPRKTSKTLIFFHTGTDCCVAESMVSKLNLK